MHGKDTNPSEKWYPWLINELKKNSIVCNAPILPKPNNPILTEWLNEIESLEPDEETVLVGHSRGGMAILRWLEKQPANLKVKKVILVAANNPLISRKNKTSNTNGFYEEGLYNYEKIKTHCQDFVVFHSKDDNWVSFESGEENAKGLQAKFLVFQDRGHFGKNLPKQEIPELLEEIILTKQDFSL